MARITLNEHVYAHILPLIDSPKDLLSICLADKALKNLAEPEMVYRHIKCTLDNTAVWEHLIKHPAGASRVRKLEIQRRNPSQHPSNEKEIIQKHLVSGPRVIPDKPSLVSVVQAEYLLVQAVRNMVNLQSFTWDTWVPVIKKGDVVLHFLPTPDGDPDLDVYVEDIWTVLRDRTEIDSLKVVDFGHVYRIFQDPFPIFKSELFTIENLVTLELKIYHSPDTEWFDSEDLVHGRGKEDVEKIRNFLKGCPHLENLSLAIHDHPFFYFSDGNPYTDVTSLISTSTWPRLTSLQLQDVTVEDIQMINFLKRHPKIRKLSASLLLTYEANIPSVPFSFENHEDQLCGILPDLEHVDFPPSVLRPLLRNLQRPTNLQSIQCLESCDFSAEGPSMYTVFLTMLDEVWSPPCDNDITEDQQSEHVLVGMPRLRMLSVACISTLKPLDTLHRLVPGLEHLMIEDPAVRYNVKMPKHEEIIQYISKWENLVSFRGPCLWPSDEELANMESPDDEVYSIASEIILACPNLRYVSWTDDSTVEILKSEEGEFEGFDFLELPSFIAMV